MHPRHLFPSLCVAAAVASCRPVERDINFAGLEPGRRSLDLRNDVKIVKLTNGLTVAMIADDRTNLVSVDVRYKVGASQDPAGRAGLAHLLEHLTFQTAADSQGGTIFEKLQAIALGFNAYTTHDVTHYTSTALANRVDALLEMEARRLEMACAKLPDAAFTRERDVVLQEEAQRTTAWTPILSAIDRQVWGPQHPYTRGVGDREAAAITKAEACTFFDTYYTPANAVLVVVGNITPDRLEPRIGRRFGPISRAATPPPPPPAAATFTGITSEHVGDVARPTARIYLPAPPWGDAEAATHDMLLLAVGAELGELDDREEWLIDVNLQYAGSGYQRTTVLELVVDDEARLDEAVTKALQVSHDVFADTDEESRKRWISALRGLQQTATVSASDAFSGKAALIADYLTFTPDLQFWFAHMRATDAVDIPTLRRRAQSLFTRSASHVALIRPSGREGIGGATHVAVSGRDYDLPTWRTPVDAADAAGPEPTPPAPPALRVYQDRLGNGLHVIMYVAPRSPTFEAQLIFPHGRIDEPAAQRGVATLAARLLDHDHQRRYPRAMVEVLNWALTSVGTQLSHRVHEESTTFTSGGLSMFGDWHLWRLAWLMDLGVYNDDTIAEFRRDLREVTERDASPSGRAFVQRLYGADHPYAAAPARKADLLRLGRGDLDRWRARNYGTDGATLVISGGFDPDEMIDLVRTLFGGLPRRSNTPRPPSATPAPTPGPNWMGTVLEDEAQVKLYVSFAATSDRDGDRWARAILAEIVTDRLRVVREGMGASYAVSSHYDVGAAGSTFDVFTALDPDRAPRAAAAVLSTLAALRGDPTNLAADFVRARRRLVTGSLATWSDATAVASDITWAVEHGGDLKQLNRITSDLAAVTLEQVAAVAARDLDPARMVVSVDGRTAPVTATLDALGATGVEWFKE